MGVIGRANSGHCLTIVAVYLALPVRVGIFERSLMTERRIMASWPLKKSP